MHLFILYTISYFTRSHHMNKREREKENCLFVYMDSITVNLLIFVVQHNVSLIIKDDENFFLSFGKLSRVYTELYSMNIVL